MAADPAKILQAQALQEFVGKVSLNSPELQEYVMVNQDRARFVFSQWRDRIRSKSAWHTPLGIVIALVTTMCTSSFQDQSWIKSGTLKGFFLLALVGAVVWLCASFWKAVFSPSAQPEEFIASLLEGTKRTEYESTPEPQNHS
jgi:hypothetical protein